MASFFSRIKDGLAKTARQIREVLGDVPEEPSAPTGAVPRPGRAVQVDTLDAVEEALIAADVGLPATERIIAAVRSDRQGSIGERVGREVRRVLTEAGAPIEITARPHVVLVVGVNGTGKTTTVG